jgi:hypothetical protein
LPTKTLLSVSVEDPKYIMRSPLVFTNVAALFPGEAGITTQALTRLAWAFGAPHVAVPEPGTLR